jgi:predicted CopG family antitoxin
MGDRKHRTQILLEPKQHEALADIARQEGRSISDLVREMIGQQLTQRLQAADAGVKRKLAAMERIRQHREAILARRGGKPLEWDVVEMIDQMREERDARNLPGIVDPGD